MIVMELWITGASIPLKANDTYCISSYFLNIYKFLIICVQFTVIFSLTKCFASSMVTIMLLRIMFYAYRLLDDPND